MTARSTPWRRRTWLGLISAALVASLSPAGSALAGTAPADDAPAPAESIGAGTGETHQVTLITGDVVQVTDLGGKTSVAVDAVVGAVHAYELDGEVYVLPERVMPYVKAGTVNRELFNVTALIKQGYADDETATLPLIVTYDNAVGTLSARTAALPASDPVMTLPSIDGAAVEVDKDSAETFWSAVDGAGAGDLGRGLEGMWLDGKVEASLDESVPLIGAPTAWQAGFDGSGVDVAVLDTGADAGHPDLTGKISLEADFTGKGSIADGHGHGTHVAATVAGTGAASGGARKGVAPGSDLMIGKVLSDGGSGFDSWVIAGMEWAANNGAEVINMSLGAFPTDGTDPLSQAVNTLTAQTGTLFVISAGNSGPSAYSVNNPGAADAALTVGNVTKAGELAFGSSRGPRVGDHAIKPDITAPGTSIVAARAAGTSLGTPVDEFYTSLSGTSMAAPHVAGAAAIVRQQHPDWMPEQVKAALVSTAVPHDDLHVYQQGGGRVDVAAAATQGVYAGPAPLNFGYLPFPQTELDPITRTVTLTNVTGADVTLNLSASAEVVGGSPAPADMVTLSQDAVTVPAGGPATVDVTVHPAAGDTGLYSGFFVGAAADGTRVSLPLGFNKEPESYDLTVTVLDRLGRPNRGATVQIGNVDDSSKFLNFPSLNVNGQATVRVPPGTYSVLGIIQAVEGSKFTFTFVAEPEIEVGPGGASVVLDGREAVPVVADVDRQTENVSAKLEFWREPVTGDVMSYRFLIGEPFTDMYATPTDEVTKGDFHLVTQFSLVEPDLLMSGSDLPEFEPEYFVFSPELDQGSYRYGVVDAGRATADDLARVDTTGKIALIEAVGGQWSEQTRAAAEDGAVLALLYTRNGFPFHGAVENNLPIPSASLDVEEADALLAWLADGGQTVKIRSAPDSPYLYDLRFDEDGRVPDSLTYEVDHKDLAEVSSSYRSDAPNRTASEVNAAFAPWQDFSFDSNRFFQIPTARTEYVTAEPELLWLKTVYGYDEQDEGVFFGHPVRDRFRYYTGDQKLSDTWFGAPSAPEPRHELTDQNRVAIPCAACRDDNELFFWIEDLGDSSRGHYGAFDTRWENSSTRLYRDGELVVSRRTGRGALPAVPDAADYRLEISSWSDAPWSWGWRTSTAWTFRSGAPAEPSDLPSWYACASGRGQDCAFLPLLFAEYDLALDSLNRAPSGQTYQFRVSVGGQPFAPPLDVQAVGVEVSYDDGATWRSVPVEDLGGNGKYQVTVDHHTDAEFVSLRLTAQAAGGSELSQEIIRAYKLS